MRETSQISNNQILDKNTIKRLKKIKEKDFLASRKRNRKNIIVSISKNIDFPINDDKFIYKNHDY